MCIDRFLSDASAMDELEQKCYDLDAKVRRVEDERDAVMNENDELQEQVAALRAVVESSSSSNANGGGSFLDESDREELVRLSEEVSRLDATQIVLRENYLVVQDKVKEVAAIKNSIKVRCVFVSVSHRCILQCMILAAVRDGRDRVREGGFPQPEESPELSCQDRAADQREDV